MTYSIAEIFLSIQGEGAHLGIPAVFVRFAGCNLNCLFCDTAHDAAPKEMALENITQEIYAVCFERGLEPKGLPCILTGGEPLLQIDLPLVLSIRNLGMYLHMETNGSLDAARKNSAKDTQSFDEVLDYFEEITLSPKVLPLSQDVFDRATTLKVLVPSTSLPFSEISDFIKKSTSIQRKTLVIQPVTPVGGIDTWEWKANISEAISVSLSRKKLYNENWRVIPQTHVLMKVR